jgi:hypothetical protein
MHKQILFGTPLIQFNLKLPEETAEIQKLLLEQEATTENSPQARSNAGGWRSGLLQGRPEKCFQALNKATNECFNKAVGATFETEHKLSWAVNSWSIINRKGDYNLPHPHPHADWSSVYYVNAGDPPDKNHENKALHFGGDIMFMDPRGALVETS